MKKVRIGIVGVGNMGSAHIKSVAEIEKAELAAICDLDKTKADEKAKAAGCKAFYNATEMLESGNIDAVIIATPHYDHLPIAAKAFECGVHVLSEKPIAVHKNDAQKMIDAHNQHPELKFAAMFQQRTIKAHMKIKQLIDNGELGEIKRVNWIITDWFRTQRYYDSGGWRATWEGEGGGVLLNQCPHQLDLFQWFFGLPVKVWSKVSIGKYHNIEVEDDVSTFCEFANGATGSFITSTGESPGTNRLEITGDRGRLVLENGELSFKRTELKVSEFCATTSESFAHAPVWDVKIPCGKDSTNAHKDVIADFVNAILEDRAPLAPAEQGINSVEFGNAMLYSGLKGVTVNMPLDGDAYEAMLMELINNSTFKKSEVKAAKVDMSSSF